MIVGRLAKRWQAQRLCLFCALRAEKALVQSSRRVHSSSKALYESAAAQVENHEEANGSLYGARYSDTQTNGKGVIEQESEDLYGARYGSRKLPSWKSKPPQRSMNSQGGVSPTSSSRSLPGFKPHYSGNATDPHVRSPPPGAPLVRRVAFGEASSEQPHKVMRNEPKSNGDIWTQKAFRLGSRETHSIESGRRHRRIQSTHPTDTNTYPNAQSKQRLGHQVESSERHESELKDRCGDRSRERNSPVMTEINNTAVDSSKDTNQVLSSGLNASRMRTDEMPRWSNLPRRKDITPELKPELDPHKPAEDSIVRFQPFRPIKVPTTDDGSEGLKLENKHSRSNNNFNQGPSGSRFSSTDYVALQETTSSTPTESERIVKHKTAVEDNDPSSELLTEPTSVGDTSKGGRRASLWEQDDLKAKKSSRTKQGKPSRRQEMSEDDGLDADKLERIEAKQRKKAERKAARDERASGQVFVVPSFISVGNLASSLKIRADAFSEVLRSQGFSDLSNDHIIDAETAGLIAGELGFKAVLPVKVSETDLIAQPVPKETDLLPPRPPIVTIMGHVDHGKTTLLDWLRNSSIAASEHGGITQHIGAFTVQMPSGRIITFLDTPGHAAFLEMRARGANVTDIVILVVAADDSVMPQTIEAIKHAKAARTQVVVAISKIDKPEADADKVRQDLARNGIEVEDYGGETQTVCVSGKTGQGMDQLEDAIIALADVLDVKADTTGNVEGWVLEAARKASGKIATVLVRRGTLKPGQIIVAGHTWARVRVLRNETGAVIDEALPGTPVEVDGWHMQPEAGAEVLQAPNEQKARRVVDYRIGVAQIEKQTADVLKVNEARKVHDEKRAREKARAVAIAKGEEVSAEEILAEGPKFLEIPLIIRADVSGSIEAINASVLALGNSEVRAIVIRSAVGNVSESDIEHAAAVKGHIVNFGLPIDGEIMRLAEQSGVKIVDANVIYRISESVNRLLEDYLPPVITHHVTGEAEILKVFDINLKGRKFLPVAGCKIRNGTMLKGSKVKVVRGDHVVYDGILSSLKNVKKDVTEMRKGTECGISFDDFSNFIVGDQVQCYETKSEKRRL